MAAIYFCPCIRPFGAAQLTDYPLCTMLAEDPECLPDHIIVVDRILHRGYRSTVYFGTCQDQEKSKVAIKFASVDRLLMEAGIYDEVKDIQGDCIPKLYGMFFGKTIRNTEMACIIMEYAGEQLTDLLSDLPRQDRAEILSHLATLHSHGLHLPDFGESNVVKAEDGSYRLIDLEDAQDHECGWSLDFRNPGEYDPYDVEGRMACVSLRSISSDMFFWTPDHVHVHGILMYRRNELPTQDVVDALPLSITCIRTYSKLRRCLEMFYKEVWVKMEKENMSLKAIQDDKEAMFLRIQKEHDEKYGTEDK
ncbi:hypothetical protein QCA50_019795 [Cerrena zonata]|uniref:Protein kinase domain-containing protein n=1 Tax=Cerrena zonata TaxID=2478898 RepID=A0AAW0FA59_9APHY